MKINKEKLVICVESELGAGGGKIAAALAKLLRCPCHDEDILREASALSGIPQRLLSRYAEKPVRHAYDLSARDEAELRLPAAQDFLAAQFAACRAIASRGACVLTEHHCNVALTGMDDKVSVFIHASREHRLNSYAEEKGLCPEEAEKSFAKEDRTRSRYFRSVSAKWGKASGYDLTVNADSAAPEMLADHIVRYIETVSREQLAHPTQARERSA